MKEQKSLNFCENHLNEFYKAMQDGNIREAEKIESQLTATEECVACAYLLKADGNIRDVLENYLHQDNSSNMKVKNHFTYWSLRFVVFALIFLITDMIVIFLKKQLFNASIGLIDITIIGVITLISFLFVDDLFFD